MDGVAGLIEPAADVEDARTTNRRSAQSGRVEFITRGDRRRVWAAAQKRKIVVESLSPETTPSDVARRYRIGTGLLYTWRRQMMEGHLGTAALAEPGFARVEVIPDVLQLEAPAVDESRDTKVQHSPPPSACAAGLMEIVLPCGVSVRVDGSVDGGALRRVLDAVERR